MKFLKSLKMLRVENDSISLMLLKVWVTGMFFLIISHTVGWFTGLASLGYDSPKGIQQYITFFASLTLKNWLLISLFGMGTGFFVQKIFMNAKFKLIK